MESAVVTQRTKNPRERGNPISTLFFLHMFPVFKKHCRTGMKEEDLYDTLDEHRSALLGNRLEEIWKQKYTKHKKAALHLALIRMFAFDLVTTGLVKLVNEMLLMFLLPYAIGGLVSYFQGDLGTSEEEAYMYAGLVAAALLLDAMFGHPNMMQMQHMCMKMRVSCCSLVYRKTLKLSSTALAQTTIGQIVNLLSNDVSKFDQGFVLLHFAWISPIQTAIATYMLYKVIGEAAFAGMAFVLIFVPMQFYLGKRTSVLRMRTALRTDERVRLMNEILNGIQVIKMYTWEKPFAKLVALARRYEIKSIRAHFFIQAVMFSLEVFVTRTSIFISLIVFIAMGYDVTADTAYTVTTIYNVIRPTMTMMFSLSIASIAEVHISVRRLHTFLCYNELPQSDTDLVNGVHENVSNGKVQENGKIILAADPDRSSHVRLKNITAKWLPENDNTLSDINFDIDKKQLVAVIGPVGSGKSSLFNVILKELPICQGVLAIKGTISYASQESWLFSSSVRQNILFGEQYEEDRYRVILKICQLESDLAMLPYGDKTIVGEKGKALSGGQKARVNLARCIYKQANIYLLDDPLSAVDTKVGKQLYEQCIKHFLSDKICILITHQLQYLKSANKILILKEGRIIGNGNYDELQNTGLDFAKLLQEFHAGEEEGPEKQKTTSLQNSRMSDQEVGEDGEEDPQVLKEGLTSGHIKASTYASFFKAGGNVFTMVLLVLAFVASQTAGSAGDYFVSYWVNLEQEANTFKEENITLYEEIDRDFITYIYAAIIGATIILAIGHSIFFFVFFMKASVNMHDYIFQSISRATMRFFNANPTGRILNRFSKDMGVIDEYIPFILSDVSEIALLLLSTIILSSLVNPWFILPSVGLLGLFYIIRMFYVETSRSIKRIEGITRSPIFSHMTATMNGLSTIRAFSAQKTLINEFDTHQDLHSSAWYLFLVAGRAFGLWLEMLCVIFISSITISLVAMNKGYYGGDVGLVVTQFLGLAGVLQWGMRQWSELENHMTSVERVLEYTKVETEPARPLVPLPKKWPEFGKIIFQNVFMRYNPEEPPVLKNLNLTIYPSEKIGVVGRTGAGKTSTIAALFQLYNVEGAIIIDDIDTTKIPLDELRSQISIIPQDPVLFSGTMRKNLDPFEEYADELLWNALEQVELKEVIAETSAGLNTTVSESGSNFSIGQRQLVCLARAIIRNNRILVMDEATANVDPHTDALIQKTIRRKFANCTVITIAHRLHTIMDSDRVLVVDSGEIVEFDHPHNLLQHTDSIFYTMVQTTGKTACKNLQTIAEESFFRLKNT